MRLRTISDAVFPSPRARSRSARRECPLNLIVSTPCMPLELMSYSIVSVSYERKAQSWKSRPVPDWNSRKVELNSRLQAAGLQAEVGSRMRCFSETTDPSG
jgi:hypothetical protein